MRPVRCVLWLSLACAAGLAGCTPAAGGATEGQALLDQAAAEATAIVQRAQATAMVLQAQAMATAAIQRANNPAATPPPLVALTTPLPTRAAALPATPGLASPPLAATAVITGMQAPGEPGVELLGVGFAADGNFIHVQFKAPPRVASQWYQGRVYVTDEATGAIYSNIPDMPKVGPLFARPKEEEQPGYVMFWNTSMSLKPGALVTVVLGDYTWEHVSVSGARW